MTPEEKKQAKREANKRWRDANKEQRAAYQQEFRQRFPDYQSRWRKRQTLEWHQRQYELAAERKRKRRGNVK